MRPGKTRDFADNDKFSSEKLISLIRKPHTRDSPCCQTNTDAHISGSPYSKKRRIGDADTVRKNERFVGLPIGRTARLVFEIDSMRAECCQAAQQLLDEGVV